MEKRPDEMVDYLAPIVAPEELGLSPIEEQAGGVGKQRGFEGAQHRRSREHKHKGRLLQSSLLLGSSLATIYNLSLRGENTVWAMCMNFNKGCFKIYLFFLIL